jgi:hypothetical protein
MTQSKEMVQMKVKYFAALTLIMALGFGGCAKLNYSQLAPNADQFHPKSVAVLPVTVGSYQQAADVMNRVIPNTLENAKMFELVVDPVMVRNKMASDTTLQDTIVDYIAKLNTLGISDPEKSRLIGSAYNVESFIVVNLSDWSRSTISGNDVYRVSFDIKYVDAASGTIIWRAGHERTETDTSIFTDPSLSEIAQELAEFIFSFMPK